MILYALDIESDVKGATKPVKKSCPKYSISRIGTRNQLGSQLAEFGPALALLVGMILIPLLDLVMIPIRWMLVQDMVSSQCRQLALCETFSEAHSRLNLEPSLATKLKSIGGVDAKSIDLRMKITRARAGDGQQSFCAHSPGEIPPDWLPDKNSSFLYTLELNVDSLLSPAILLPIIGPKIPGLNSAVAIEISSSHAWENLGRDPNNKRFYIAE